MKKIFQAVSTFFDNAFFEPPRLQINQAEKSFMADNGYKVIRAIASHTMPYINVPIIEYDLILHANSEQLNPEEYKVAQKALNDYRNPQQDNGPDLTNNAPK